MEKLSLSCILVLLIGTIQSINTTTNTFSLPKILPLAIARGIAMRDRLNTTRQQQQYKAPDFVQKQAQKFMDALVPQTIASRFLNRCKTVFGCIIVYEGAQEKIFQQNPLIAAFTFDMCGIHFPANTFTGKTLTNQQYADLCHEVTHVYYSHAFDGIHKIGNKSWYEHEYQAEKKTIKILCQLNMQDAAEEHFVNRVFDMNRAILELSPYIIGVIDSFYTLFQNCPEKVKNETAKKFIQELIAKKIPSFTWEERYEKFVTQTQKKPEPHNEKN